MNFTKSRIINGSRKGVDNLCEDLNKVVVDYIQSERLIWIITMMRYFGLGKSRVLKLVKNFNDVHKEFQRYKQDGISEEKIKEEFEVKGIDFKEILPQRTSFKLSVQKMKKEKEIRENINCSTAKALHEQMIAFGNHIGGKKKNE